MLTTLTANYDEEFDILYIRSSSPKDSYADEDEDGVIALRSISDNSITGMVLYDFKQRLHSGEFSTLQLPIKVNFDTPEISAMLSHNSPNFRCTLSLQI